MLVTSYGIICFEDLNIKNMTQNHNLAKSILDASWNKLVQYTSYKAVEAGRKVVLEGFDLAPIRRALNSCVNIFNLYGCF